MHSFGPDEAYDTKGRPQSVRNWTGKAAVGDVHISGETCCFQFMLIFLWDNEFRPGQITVPGCFSQSQLTCMHPYGPDEASETKGRPRSVKRWTGEETP